MKETQVSLGARTPAAGRAEPLLRWYSVYWPALLAFVCSRVAFLAAAGFGTLLLPLADEPAMLPVPGPFWLSMHWRWDAVYYYTISTGGYESGGLTAFFPAHPLLARLVATVLNGFSAPVGAPIQQAALTSLVAGIIAANAAALLAFCMLLRLAREELGDEATAQRALFYMAFFPMAFYYAVPYTEALFLATSVGFFLSARRGRWISAGLWAAAASATRLIGVLLAAALLIEIVLTWRSRRLGAGGGRRAIIGLLLAPTGLASFMLYLWWLSGDPLSFVRVQADWYHEKMFPLVALGRGIAYALNPSWSAAPDLYARGVLNTAIVVGFLAVMAVSWRRWRPSYLFYGTLLALIILASPLPGERVMHSLGRYIMVLFPVYFTLARWGRRPAVHWAILGLWLPLFGLLAALYARWFPVA